MSEEKPGPARVICERDAPGDIPRHDITRQSDSVKLKNTTSIVRAEIANYRTICNNEPEDIGITLQPSRRLLVPRLLELVTLGLGKLSLYYVELLSTYRSNTLVLP